jgi:hypothetical protein
MSSYGKLHPISAAKTIDLTEEEDAFLESRPRTGTLTINCIEAKDLPKKKVQGYYVEIFTKPMFVDPKSIYAHRAFSGGNDKSERLWKSEVKPANFVPKWDGDLKASFELSQATTLKLEVWGKNRLAKDLFMGYVYWTPRKVGQLQRENKTDGVCATLELSGDEKSEIAGSVVLIVTWTGKDPEPEPAPAKAAEQAPAHPRTESIVAAEEKDDDGKIRQRWKVIHKSTVNVRSEPNFTASQVGTLNPEDVVNELEQRDGWVRHATGWSIITSGGHNLLWKYSGR